MLAVWLSESAAALQGDGTISLRLHPGAYVFEADSDQWPSRRPTARGRKRHRLQLATRDKFLDVARRDREYLRHLWQTKEQGLEEGVLAHAIASRASSPSARAGNKSSIAQPKNSASLRLVSRARSL